MTGATVRVERLCAVNEIEPGDRPALRCSASTGSAWCASATTSTPSATAAATPTSRWPTARCIRDEREIECWKHGSTFSLVDGKPQSLPATRPVPVYDVRRDGDDVLVVIR